MTNKKEDTAKAFTTTYYRIFQSLCDEYNERTGEQLKPYKEYEPEYLYNFCVQYIDEKDIVKQISKILSKLIIIQALPNANHRTAFFLMNIYCLKPEMRLKIYDEKKQDYDKFIDRSKRIIDTDISHVDYFNENYFDAHHTKGIEKHLGLTTELIKNILVKPQSGIVTVESFQIFIARLIQTGSFPF